MPNLAWATSARGRGVQTSIPAESPQSSRQGCDESPLSSMSENWRPEAPLKSTSAGSTLSRGQRSRRRPGRGGRRAATASPGIRVRGLALRVEAAPRPQLRHGVETVQFGDLPHGGETVREHGVHQPEGRFWVRLHSRAQRARCSRAAESTSTPVRARARSRSRSRSRNGCPRPREYPLKSEVAW